MKRILSLVLLLVFAIASSFRSSAQNADINGIWKLDRTKSTIVESLPVLVRIDVQIKGDSLLTQRYYETADGQEYPFKENVSLNGQECNIIVYNMPRKTKANWAEQDGLLIVESTTTFNGQNGPDNFISKETWKADTANKTVTISYKNNISTSESAGILFFNKAE
jgi:hypothetical protein